MRCTAHKVRVLLAGALLAGLLTAGFGTVTGAAVLCGPGETFDKGRCVPGEPDEARRETRDVNDGTRNVNDQRTTTTVRPIRTIREGQSTTFTAPNPSANDRRVVTRCAPFAGRRGRATPTPQFRPDGTLVCDYSIGVPYFDDVAKTATSNSVSTFGPCRGPYTVEVVTPDSRVEHAGGRRIKVTTSTSDNLDDTGTVEVEYFLVGTSTNTFAQTNPGATVHTSTSECTLLRTAHVEVRTASRRGMTAAVAKYSPSQAWIDDTTTVNWTCDQTLLDWLAAQDPPIPAYCDLGDEVETTTENEWPTPRRCVIVVTVTDRGHGSTGCVTNDQAASIGDVKGYDHSTLPTCPDPLPPDKGYRCVARN